MSRALKKAYRRRLKEPPIPVKTIDPKTFAARKCTVRGCPIIYYSTDDLIYCPRHRANFMAHSWMGGRKKTKFTDIPIPTDEELLVDDELIYDENGRLVWCKDLARRYRREMLRGNAGDFKGRLVL